MHASVWTPEPFRANRRYFCDEQGETTVALPGEIRILRLWAHMPHRVEMFAQWWPEHQPQDPPIPAEYTFHLEPGTTIGGVVLNEKGEPIRNATVEAKVDFPGDNQQPFVRLCVSTWLATEEEARVTDADGRWSLDNVPADENAEVTVMLHHRDYVSDHQWGELQLRTRSDDSATARPDGHDHDATRIRSDRQRERRQW